MDGTRSSPPWYGVMSGFVGRLRSIYEEWSDAWEDAVGHQRRRLATIKCGVVILQVPSDQKIGFFTVRGAVIAFAAAY